MIWRRVVFALMAIEILVVGGLHALGVKPDPRRIATCILDKQ